MMESRDELEGRAKILYKIEEEDYSGKSNVYKTMKRKSLSKIKV